MTSDIINVAIIGTGNIGTDLCARILKDERFNLVAFIGRRANSAGLQMFEGQVQELLANGVQDLLSVSERIEGFFDATTAFDHKKHWDLLKDRVDWAIDLTPSQVGVPMVPELIGLSPQFSLNDITHFNFSMVTCGGQSAAPLIYSMSKFSRKIEEIEISSSIASKSAGPATRLNIDHYIESTENLAKLISKCNSTKAILVLNPAEPPIMMRTTVQMKIEDCNLANIQEELERIVMKIKTYVPGYEVVIEPHFSNKNVISATAKVKGAGFVLPEYAGNLDIINAAAVETAKKISMLKKKYA